MTRMKCPHGISPKSNCDICRKEYLKKYHRSPKYKEYQRECMKKYYQSHRQQILECQKRYNQSPKYKEYQKKYRQSPGYKEYRRNYMRNYMRKYPQLKKMEAKLK